MQNVLIVIHVIISIILCVIVLMQHGKQQGLSGAIAGGAETFFGKNKGRTIDAMLKKFTSVVAALFIISSVVLAFVSVSEHKANTKTVQEAAVSSEEGQQTTATLDENGNLVDDKGNILITAEDLKAAETQTLETENTEKE